MRFAPAFPAGLAVLAGTLAFDYCLPERRPLALAIVACAVFLGLALLPRRSWRVSLCLLLVAALDSSWHAARELPLQSGWRVVAGTVASSITREAWESVFTLALDEGGQLRVTGRVHGVAPGDHAVMRGRVEPFDEPRNPGEPSERRLQGERGVEGRMLHAHVLARTHAFSLLAILARARAWAAAQFSSRLDDPYGAILAGELWGEKSALSPDLRAEFIETGTVHILVTAGLHLGVIAALIALAVGAVGIPRAPACVIAIGFIWTYAWFSGDHLPSVRAAAMITFALAARAFGRKALSWNAFWLALAVVCLLSPRSAFSGSFLLSFSCVGAILLLAGPLGELGKRAEWLPGRARNLVAVACAAQLGTWPLTATMFLVFAPYAALANLAIVPVVGATMLLGIAQLLVSPLDALAQTVANVNSWLLAWIVGVVHVLANAPAAQMHFAPPASWQIAGYDLALICAGMALRKARYAAAVALFAAGCALTLAVPHRCPSELTITALDVGQADGIVIRTPSGLTYLVDAGGRLERGLLNGESVAEDVGKRIVVPFLLRSGVHHVAGVFISHPHGDHVGGVAPVLRTFGDDLVLDSGQPYGGFAYRDAVAVAHASHVPILTARAGERWRTRDGVSFTFYSPQEPLLAGTRNDINNNSLVFMLQYKWFRMLFTGDAGAEAERRMLASGFDLHADVLKVGHHGSSHSSLPEFIGAVQPRYAVISVGRHNLFGHPALQTLETLRAAGARIYRTDENGAVTIHSDGTSLSIESMLPSAGSVFLRSIR